MTRDELKIRTQQAIYHIPTLRKRDDGWSQIESILNEILIELYDNDSDWHTGSPTEEGWYLLECNIGNSDKNYYTTDYWSNACKDWTVNRVIRWQKIEKGEEVNG